MSASSLTITPKALADAVAAVKVGINRKASIQALGGVRITATRARAALTTGHTGLSARAPISAKVTGKLDCVVSHADLTKALKLFARFAELTLTDEVTEIVLTAGNRTISLRTLRVEDCQPFPTTAGTLVLEAKGDLFAEAFKRADAFSCRDESRPVLTSILVDWNDGLTLVATDSYRLAAVALEGAKRKVRKARKPEQNRLMIGRKLADAGAVLAAAERITVTEAGEHVIVQAGGVTLAVRGPSGHFPDYRKLLPEDSYPNRVTVPTSQLAAASDVAAAFVRGHSPARLNVNGTVKLHGATLDVCSFEELLPDAIASMEGNSEFEIGLNPEFLRDILRAVRSDTTTIRLLGPLRPALIEDNEDMFLLMPIRLNV